MGFSAQKKLPWRPVSIVLLGVIFVTFLFQAYPRAPFQICYRDSTQSEAGKSRIKIFNKISTFEDLSPENDEAFEAAITTKQKGFIAVKHNETYNVARGISMFHAMHCVSLIRGMLQTEIEKPIGSSQEHEHHSYSPKNKRELESSEHFHHTHIPHCLSYIAQSILCAGDGTIEQPWLIKDEAGNILLQGVDGNGMEHKCKNTDLLWSIARKSEREPFDDWGWSPGDTVESVFGSSRARP